MQQNRIVVFNRIIDRRIEDCSFFERFLENHYSKFTYGYNIITLNDLIDDIKDVECEICKDNGIILTITLRKKMTRKFFRILEKNTLIAYGNDKHTVQLTQLNEKGMEIEIKEK